MAPQVRFAWLGEAWRLFCACKGVWLAVTALHVGLAFLLCIGLALLISANDHSPPTPSAGFWTDFWQVSLGLDVLAGLCYLGVCALLSGGAHRMAVRQVRGEPIGFRDLFRPRRPFLPGLGYALMGGTMISAGWLLCLAPGWAMTALLLPVPAQIADGDSVWSAIATGVQAMGRCWGSALALTGLLYLLIALGLAPYLLGLLVVQPLLWLTAALAYRDMIDLPRRAPPPLPDYGVAQWGCLAAPAFSLRTRSPFVFACRKNAALPRTLSA